MKNSIKNTLIGIVGAGALTIGALGLTGCNSNQTNLGQVVKNYETCTENIEISQGITNDLQKWYNSVPMKNKEVDISKLDEHYKDFLKLSNQERLEKIKMLGKEDESVCKIYENIKELTDKEALALYGWEGSFYAPMNIEPGFD